MKKPKVKITIEGPQGSAKTKISEIIQRAFDLAGYSGSSVSFLHTGDEHQVFLNDFHYVKMVTKRTGCSEDSTEDNPKTIKGLKEGDEVVLRPGAKEPISRSVGHPSYLSFLFVDWMDQNSILLKVKYRHSYARQDSKHIIVDINDIDRIA